MTCPPPTQWLPAREAAPLLGIPRGSLDRKGRLGKLPRRKCPERDVWLYECPLPLGETQGEERGGRQEEAQASAPPFVPIIEEHDRYTYIHDHQGMRYVINMRSLAQNVTFEASFIEDLVRAYSNDGGGAQVQEICREFALSERSFYDIQAALGFTHTSPPWTREHIARTDEATLVRDGEMAKLQRVRQQIQRRAWARTISEATLWRRGPHALIEAIERQGESLQIPPLAEPLVYDAGGGASWSGLIAASDTHIGKRAWGSDPEPPMIQGARLAQQLFKAADRVLEWGTPGEWIVLVGSDLLHVDNDHYATTRGTSQGGQVQGSLWAIWQAAFKMMAALIEHCAVYAPVRVVCIPGNHDWVLSTTVGAALRERYRETGHVEVLVGEEPFRVLKVGEIPVMFDHGDNIRARDYPALLAREMAPGCDIRRGVVFRGHTHQPREESPVGVRVVTMPSPSKADDWHRKKGYVGRGCIGAYKLDHREGLVGAAWVYGEEG